MRTSRMHMLHLDDGDMIEVRFGDRRFVISADSKRSSRPIIELPNGAEVIFVPRSETEEGSSFMEESLPSGSSIFI